MRIVLQRVKKASVAIDGEINGSIEQGFLALVGFCEEDDESVIPPMIDKMVGLRVFEDADGKMNLAMSDVGGKLLVVSQFTLYADCRKGRRPSFNLAKNPADAEKLYDSFVAQCNEKLGYAVPTGSFGADMAVELINDGPVTIILDSAEIVK